ncbi:DUF373 family protein [Candidatus Bathyarchaeota archaeon]|nr:MAG: hypothetical protein B6U84_03265 [Candidatus Bathyarchaeota archaeon ex4484_40]RJS77163.1 MAG: DUF373 family protein [Candidatus Bathyarchaeota archaeon]
MAEPAKKSEGLDSDVRERVLILCVDRDNDVGKKANVETPIVGRSRNMDAALKLILTDPEEADANAMFEAIRIYNELSQKSNDIYEIATIAGSELGGVEADRKIVSELKRVLEGFPADGVILVTDGFSDEDILPLVQSRIPVTSVRRVVVKHSESIEETAAIFSKYLKMLVEDPRYSKMALGLPGLLLIVLASLWFIGVFIPYDIGTWAWIAALFIVGSYLLTRGYRLDEKIIRFYNWFTQAYYLPELITRFSLGMGVILVAISLYQAWSYVAGKIPYPWPTDMASWLALLPFILGNMISKSITLITIGIGISISGKLIRYLMERDSRFWRTTTMLVTCVWLWVIFNQVSVILLHPDVSPYGLVFSTIAGIIVVVASGFGMYLLSRKYRKFFGGLREAEE